MKPLIKTVWWAIRVVAQYLLMTIVVLAVFSLIIKVHFLAVAVAIIVTIVLGIVVLCMAGLFIWSCFMSLREYYLAAKKVESLKESNKKEDSK